jgi:hypothetical protein
VKLQEGIKPMWEDDNNKRGGRWLINLDKRQRGTSLDHFWLEVMLCLIGEAFDEHSKYVSNACIGSFPHDVYHVKTRLKILPVLTREHYTSLLHWV